MKKYLILVLIYLLIIVIVRVKNIYAYPWPIPPFNSQHQVMAVLGDYRDGHFHNGIDITANVGDDVFPIESGTLTWDGETGENQGVIVRTTYAGEYWYEYWYVHIERIVPNNQNVIGIINDIVNPTHIGDIYNYSSPHLHFSEDFGALNPLRIGGITPFSDLGPATIPVDELYFVRQGNLADVLNQNLLDKHVDISVRARDNGTLIDGSVAGWWWHGIYWIGYQIIDHQGRIVKDLIQNPPIKFDWLPAPAINSTWNFDVLFDTIRSDAGTNPHYLVTNSPFDFSNPDTYWNTKQKKGANFDIDATHYLTLFTNLKDNRTRINAD